MKNNTIIKLFTVCAVIYLSSCGGGGESTPDPIITPTTYSSGEISEDVTWTSDNVYVLDGRVVVPNGVTLTIEAGTVIKAEGGQEADASCLLVARGGKLMAMGTASQPIIMTSVADNISSSHPNYPGFANLNEGQKGLWGGLIVLGNAPVSVDGDAVAFQIEGVPASDPNGLYGGTDASDNSGTIQYLQVRHGGTNIGEGNEINGITFGGVGSGTTVSNVEVIANVDDGIEMFGGSVNVSNAIVWAQGDDAFDVDQAYSGTISNFMYIGDASSDHGLEIDGPEGSMLGSFSLTGGTMKGYNPDGGEYADFRDEAAGSVSNMYFWNHSCSSDFEIDGGSSTANITFSNLQFNTSHLDATCKVDVSVICDDQTGNGTNFDATNVSTGSTGASSTLGVGWSCTVYEGAHQ